MAVEGQKLDLLVYAGPGALERPDNVALLNATKLVLFEPDPERRGALAARFKGKPNVELREEALSGVTGYARLGRYNDPEMNSLRAPTELLRFLPGLRHVGHLDVKRLDASQYVSGLADNDMSARLVIDVNGEELAILNSLIESSLLHYFAEIHVYAGVSQLFEGAGDRAGLIALLGEHGFVVKAEVGQGGFMACVRARRSETYRPRRPQDAEPFGSPSEAPRPDMPPEDDRPPVPPPAAPLAGHESPGSGGLRDQLEAAQSQIAALLEDNEAKDAQIQAQNRRASTTKAMITKLRKRVEAAREIAIERDELRVELADVRALANEAERASATTQEKLDRARTEQAEISGKLDEARKLLKAADTASEALRAELARSEAERARLEEALADAGKQIEDGDSLRQALTLDVAGLKMNLETARADLAAKQAELDSVLARSEAERARLEEALVDAGKQIKDGDGLRQALALEAAAVKTSLETASADLAAKQAELDAAKADAAAARQALDTVRQEAQRREQDSTAQIETLSAKVEDAKRELSAQEARLQAEHAKKLEGLKAELDERSRLAQELEARNSRFDGEFVRAEAQLDLIKELLFHDQPE